MPMNRPFLKVAREAASMYFEPIEFVHWTFREQKKPTSPIETPIRSLLGEGILVRGDIEAAQHGLRIDGHHVGNIKCQDGLIVVSHSALVEGDVEAGYIIVNGRVRGNLKASHAIELQPGAVVEGDIYAAVFEMHQGAAVRGKMEATEEPNSEKFASLRKEARRLSEEGPRVRLVK